jgi:hypothetical protein
VMVSHRRRAVEDRAGGRRVRCVDEKGCCIYNEQGIQRRHKE